MLKDEERYRLCEASVLMVYPYANEGRMLIPRAQHVLTRPPD